MVTIQPVNFYIPPEIQAGLASGELIRYGGVVRDGAGQLVKHLKEVPLSESGRDAAQRFAASLKNPWVVVGVGLGAVAITSITTFAVRKRTAAKRLVAQYNTSFGKYLEGVRDGTLDANIIDQLISNLDAVKASSDMGTITVGFSTEQSETLVNLVAEYTAKLAAANSVDLDLLGANEASSGGGAVTNLRSHLEAQKQIFKRAA